MTIAERKKSIKKQIDSSDEATLDKIEKILKEEKVLLLNDEQIKEVQEAREEYLKGNTISHEQVKENTKKWFEEK